MVTEEHVIIGTIGNGHVTILPLHKTIIDNVLTVVHCVTEMNGNLFLFQQKGIKIR